jgi:hypothetical protein
MREINPRLVGYAALRGFGRAACVAGALFAFLALAAWFSPYLTGIDQSGLTVALLAAAFGLAFFGAGLLERADEVLVMTLLDAAVGGVDKRRSG